MRSRRKNPISAGVQSFLGTIDRESKFCGVPLIEIVYDDNTFEVFKGDEDDNENAIILTREYCYPFLQNIAYTAKLANDTIATVEEFDINELFINFQHDLEDRVEVIKEGPEGVRIKVSSPLEFSGKEKCKYIASLIVGTLLTESDLGEPIDKAVNRVYRKNLDFKDNMHTVTIKTIAASDIFTWASQTPKQDVEDTLERVEESVEEVEAVISALEEPTRTTQPLQLTDIFTQVDITEEDIAQNEPIGEALDAFDFLDDESQVDQELSEDLLAEFFDEPSATSEIGSRSVLEDLELEQDAPSLQLTDIFEQTSTEPEIEELELEPQTDLQSVIEDMEERYPEEALVEDISVQDKRELLSRLYDRKEKLQRLVSMLQNVAEDVQETTPRVRTRRPKAIKAIKAFEYVWTLGGFDATLTKKPNSSQLNRKGPAFSRTAQDMQYVFSNVLGNIANVFELENTYTVIVKYKAGAKPKVVHDLNTKTLRVTLPESSNFSFEDIIGDVAANLNDLFSNYEFAYRFDAETLLMEIGSFL